MKFSFSSTLLAAASLVATVSAANNAALISALQTISTDAKNLDSKVASFSASSGLFGALPIAQGASALSTDLDNAISAAENADSSSSSQYASEIVSLQAPIVQLLTDLVSKNSAFSSLGVSSVVKNDLSELENKSFQLAEEGFKIIKCGDDGNTVKNAFDVILTAFTKANSAYGNSSPAPPTYSCVSA